MFKSKLGKSKLGKVVPAAAMAVALGCSALAPVAAMADPVSSTTDGVEVESQTNEDANLREQATANVNAVIDSTGGTWSDGKVNRSNGTYVVTVPTQVGYKNVNVGKVDLTAPYDVNVKGVIGTGDKITCTVTYDKAMAGALTGVNGGLLGGVGPYDKSDGGELNVELTQGKTAWSDAEVSKLAEDGNTVVGTTGTDSLHFTGSVRSASQFVQPLEYQFSTGYANIAAALNKTQSGE